MELNEIQKNLLSYSAQDDMGFWVVIWEITGALTSNDSPRMIRQNAIHIVKEMIENGWIEIGTIVKKDSGAFFQPFSFSVDEAITFIESEWDKLGRIPSLGEICWFRATPAGKKLADDLGLVD